MAECIKECIGEGHDTERDFKIFDICSILEQPRNCRRPYPACYVVWRLYDHAKSCESLQAKSKYLVLLFKILRNLLAGPALVRGLGKLLPDVIVVPYPNSSLLGQLARPTESGIAKIVVKNEQLAHLGESRPRLDERF